MVTVNIGGGGGGGGGDVDMTFLQDGTLAVRDAVYLSSTSNTVKKASAAALSTTPAIGFVATVVSPTQVKVRTEKIMTGFSGLTPSVPMFLSTVAGAITPTAPTSAGTVVQELAIAVTATDILIRVDTDSTVNA
jgi:hypothetical protein